MEVAAKPSINDDATVTDPVTHLPVEVHPIPSEEIGESSEAAKALSSSETSPGAKISVSNERHASMDALVEGEAHSDWWEELDENKLNVHTALVASTAAGVGAFGGLAFFAICRSLLGRHRSGFGWRDLVIGGVGCVVLTLVAGTLTTAYMHRGRKINGVPPSKATQTALETKVRTFGFDKITCANILQIA